MPECAPRPTSSIAARLAPCWPIVLLCAATLVQAAPAIKDLGGDQFEITFVYQGDATTKSVHLAGTFNNWDRTARKLDGPDGTGRFTTRLILKRGAYEYKFVVNDSKWISDPGNPHVGGGHRNSLLYVGVTPATNDLAGKTAEVVEMAELVPHPPEIELLKRALSEEGADVTAITAVTESWLASHPQPLFTEEAVSFLCYSPGADAVGLITTGHGFRHGYEMGRLLEHVPLFAVSLNRRQLVARMSYRFQIERNGESYTQDDPHAWTMTTQAGNVGASVAQPDPRKGRVRIIHDFKDSAGKLDNRDLWIYLPPGYDNDCSVRYPALYMHDGQNLWDDTVEPFGHGGWRVNDVADRLIASGQVRPFIGVGVANTADRMDEYGPGKDIFAYRDHAYLQFLKRDVKPYVDSHYRTKPGSANTAIMGSSMGGVISFQAVMLDPQTWGSAACLSSAFWIPNEKGQSYFDLPARTGKLPVRLYLDSGTAGPGQDGAPDTRKMVKLLTETGWKLGADMMHFEDEGAPHNEKAWSQRLHRPLLFLFGK